MVATTFQPRTWNSAVTSRPMPIDAPVMRMVPGLCDSAGGGLRPAQGHAGAAAWRPVG
jgi:hypothetical protein